MRYLLDANSIITPFRLAHLRALSIGLRHASPSETREFLWGWFSNAFKTGCLLGSEELFLEVCGNQQDDWASRLLRQLRSDGHVITLSPQPATLDYLKQITQFVQTHYAPHHAETFLKGSDPMLIALAKTYDSGIITEERYAIPQCDGASMRINGSVSLPYVAWAFGVSCIPLFYALLQLEPKSLEGSNEIDIPPGA